jgi:thioredoxin-dependent peroxiredoxin
MSISNWHSAIGNESLYSVVSNHKFVSAEDQEMSKYAFVLAFAIVAVLACNRASAVNELPAVGAAAPTFNLTNNEGKQVSLADFKGKWVVLYFYPKDFTSGCTLQARNFQRDLAKYEAINAVILGVSVDTAESHKEFCAKEGLNFKLLADVGAKVSEQYGSIMDYQGNKLSARNTFIIDPQGKIAKVYEKVKVGPHSEEVLAALAELQK